jgi:CRISPR-associated protein Cas1
MAEELPAEPVDLGANDAGVIISEAAAPPLIPARMVNEFVYCPRLFYLEWVQGDFRHNADTLEGVVVHRRVDREDGPLPEPEMLKPGDRIAARGVLLSAQRLGVIARIDLLEGADGQVRPVDYKKGSPGRNGPWEADQVQLCVQGLILRENGYRCDEGIVYYAATRQRFVVPFDAALIRRTLAALEELQEVAAAPTPPPPLRDSPKCPRCSLVGICLPDEVNLLRGAAPTEVRRLIPARPEASPLYVISQGATVGKNGERLSVRTSDGQSEAVRLIDISELSIFGQVQVTTAAIRALVDQGVPILHHTYGGWLVAVTTPLDQPNVHLRIEQYRVAGDDQRALWLARMFVSGKIRNQRTMLRRNHRGRPTEALAELARLARAAEQATTMEELLGIEGAAAHWYFSLFGGMLKTRTPFDFTARTRRPPTDPVNAILSFLYSLLTKEAVRACAAVGFDPAVGFFHRLRPGRPSLALDLAEEFRPLVADSVALNLLNNGVLTEGDFLRRGPACVLRDQARRTVLDAYEARVETVVRHPVFGYAVSYRRVLEIQARLLARVISGEINRYRPFTTR